MTIDAGLSLMASIKGLSSRVTEREKKKKMFHSVAIVRLHETGEGGGGGGVVG